MNIEAMRSGQVVLEFQFAGTYAQCRRYWLVVEDGEIDMCFKHTGHEVDLVISADIRRFVEAWRGFRDLRAELAGGAIRVEGREDYRRALPEWLLGSSLAPFERRRPGPERDLFDASRSVAAE